MRKSLSFVTLLLGCFLFLPAANGGENFGEEKVFKAVIGKDGVQPIDVVGGNYFFNPNHIIVKVNVPVELRVKKEPGIVPHDILMKSPEAGMDFKKPLETERKMIRFIPTRIGRYPFYCDKKLLFSRATERREWQESSKSSNSCEEAGTARLKILRSRSRSSPFLAKFRNVGTFQIEGKFS